MEQRTDVISRLRERISTRDMACTSSSSVRSLMGIYKIKPFRSRSRASERVSGECREPASTTTSVLAPFLARCTRRFTCCLRRRHRMKAPVPTKATAAAVRARCSDTQILQASRYPI